MHKNIEKNMSGKEIHNIIEENMDRIQELMDPTQFVLVPEIEELLCENKYLQKICHHEFVNGECKWCYTKER